MHTGMFATLNQQELYEFLIEAKNEWNKRYENECLSIRRSFDDKGIPIVYPCPVMKKAYLHFESPEKKVVM